MTFLSHAGLRIHQFDSLGPDVLQGVFTRQGGTSPEPWASLNLGGTVGDNPERVRENRRRAFAAMDLPPENLFDVWQVHGVEVAIAEAPHPRNFTHLQADAILTERPGLTLMMRFADCVPILLHDPERKVIGIAHAGWLGTVRGTVRAAVEAMHARFACSPGNLLAAIGPSIGPDHYAVGPDVVSRVREAFGQEAAGLLIQREGETFFDLWAANSLLLEQAGVKHIETSALCTACHLDDWYSHRAEKGRTGRFGVLYALKS